MKRHHVLPILYCVLFLAFLIPAHAQEEAPEPPDPPSESSSDNTNLTTIPEDTSTTEDENSNANLFDFGQNDEPKKTKAPLNQYDKKYRPVPAQGQGYTIIPTAKPLLPNDFYGVAFVHLPGASPNDMTINVASPGTISGCLKVKPAQITPEFIGESLILNMTEAQFRVDTSTVRYAHHQCELASNASLTEVTVHLDELKSKNVKKLSIKSKTIGKFIDGTIKIDDHKVTLESETGRLDGRLSEKILCHGDDKPPECKITFWIYPPHTVVLSSNALNKSANKNLIQQIKSLGSARGLTPLEDIIPGFEPDRAHKDLVYMVDDKNIYGNDLATPEDRYLFGGITTTEVFYGPQGAFDKPVKKAVYARMPGIYE